jgi:hypothetical protein
MRETLDGIEFSPQGHLALKPSDLVAGARVAMRTMLNHYLLAGTPYVFHTFSSYCAFHSDLAYQ